LQRGTQDPRDGLDAYLDAIEKIRPLTIEMENVPNMLKHEDAIRHLRDRLVRLGYLVTLSVVNMAEHGVPQKRKRLILLGSLFGQIFPPMESGEPSSYGGGRHWHWHTF
jgi:DNA (cytosine-5)-methyltransferase 1